jgi:tetratricopeptide (TPR) repeat protein
MNLGDLSGARDNLERLRGEAEEAGDAEVASSASLALGNLLLTTGDADAALGWYERATAETAQIAVSREMALGRLALAQGSLEEAERRLGTAVRLGRESEL